MRRMRRLLPVVLSAALLSPLGAWAKPGDAPRSPATRPSRAVTPAKLVTHTVYPGQTLGMIAKRYNISVEVLCQANAITRRSKIKPGQKLLIPNKDYAEGDAPLIEQAPKKEDSADKPSKSEPATPTAQELAREAEELKRERQRASRLASWKKYVRPARRAGYVTLKATGRDWQGYALVKGNRISPAGQRGFRHAMYSWRTGAETDIDPRLIRLLVKVSDTFGGRTLQIVSGFREHSYAKESKHKKGHACDLSIEGVPNEVLRDYLLTLDQVGVGYYPNSSFVHVDVRPQSTQWVDRSSPGERPEYDHVAAR